MAMKRILAAIAVFAWAGETLAERMPLSRYQSIIDRQMFGQPPNGFDPNKNPNEVKGGKGSDKALTEEQEKLQHSVRFSMINITPSGETAVGFTDNTDGKNPVHYYLKVGERRNGWEVKEADPVRAWMRLAKGDVEVELELGGTSGEVNASKVKADMAAQASQSAQAPKILPAMAETAGSQDQPRNTLLKGGSSLRARRAQRAAMEEERKRAADEARARQEEEREEIRNDFMAMREEMRLQREEREEAFLEMERRREEDERRRREEEDRRRREEEDRKEPDNGSGEDKE